VKTYNKYLAALLFLVDKQSMLNHANPKTAAEVAAAVIQAVVRKKIERSLRNGNKNR